MEVEHELHNDCPYCGYKCDAASGINTKAKPMAGAFSICLDCGELAIFSEDLKLRKSEDHEKLSLMLSDSWPVVEKATKEIKRRGRLQRKGESG